MTEYQGPPIMGADESIIEYTRRLDEYDYYLITRDYNRILSIVNEIFGTDKKALSDIRYMKMDNEIAMKTIENRLVELQELMREIIIPEELNILDFLNRLLGRINYRIFKRQTESGEYFSIITKKC